MYCSLSFKQSKTTERIGKGPLLLPEKGVRQSSKKSSKVVSAVLSITFSPFNIFQHISTYFNIFQHISTYFNIFQHGIWVVSCQPFCPAFPAFRVCLRANSGSGMESEWRCHVYSVSSVSSAKKNWVFQGFFIYTLEQRYYSIKIL